jgi:uncharacterized protein YigA (DUF484 family)
LPDAAPAAGLAAAEVVRFLRTHPRFLADNPELYRHLAPPERVHGEALADHMAAQLRAARGEASAMAARAEGVLAAGRAAAGLAQRVQEAVLLLIGGGDIADLVATAFPACLAVDAAALCAESPLAGARRLSAGSVAMLLGAGTVRFRHGAPPDPALHGEAARLAAHEAFIRIPGDGTLALLALAARDGTTLDPLQGSGALAFLGRAVAAALGR